MNYAGNWPETIAKLQLSEAIEWAATGHDADVLPPVFAGVLRQKWPGLSSEQIERCAWEAFIAASREAQRIEIEIQEVEG